MRKALNKFDGLLIVKLAIILFFIVFLLIPLFSVFIVSFTGVPINFFGSFISIDTLMKTIEALKNSSFEHYMEIASRSGYLTALINSLSLSIGVSIVVILLCLPIAYGIARTNMPFKKTLSALCIVPLVMPTFVASHALILMFGKTGWVTFIYQHLGGEGFLVDPYSVVGIAFVQVFFFFPYALWPMVAAFKVSDISLEEGSENLGAKRWVTLIFVTFPLALPGIISSGLLVFTVSFSDFGTPIILAPKNFSLIVVQAYRELTGFFNWAGASILTVVMIVVAGVLFWLQRVVTKKMSYGVISGKPKAQKLNNNPMVRTILSIYTIIVVLVPFLAAASIFVQSFATTWGANPLPDGYTFANYQDILSSSADNIFNTLILAGGALILSAFIATFLSYFVVRQNSSALDFMSSIPLVVPGIAFGIALIQTFNTAPLALYGTAIILVIAFSIRRLPYMVRSTIGTMQSIKRDIEEASINLGASRLTAAITVIGPLMLPGIAAGSILVFVTVVKETSISVLMAPADWAPMTLAIFEFLLRGEFYPASAMAVIMIIVVLVLQTIANRISGGKT